SIKLVSNGRRLGKSRKRQPNYQPTRESPSLSPSTTVDKTDPPTRCGSGELFINIPTIPPEDLRTVRIDSDSSRRGFDRAIADGSLSRDPEADNYAGRYMWMYCSQNGRNYFKHCDTRTYIVSSSILESTSHPATDLDKLRRAALTALDALR